MFMLTNRMNKSCQSSENFGSEYNSSSDESSECTQRGNPKLSLYGNSILNSSTSSLHSLGRVYKNRSYVNLPAIQSSCSPDIQRLFNEECMLFNVSDDCIQRSCTSFMNSENCLLDACDLAYSEAMQIKPMRTIAWDKDLDALLEQEIIENALKNSDRTYVYKPKNVILEDATSDISIGARKKLYIYKAPCERTASTLEPGKFLVNDKSPKHSVPISG